MKQFFLALLLFPLSIMAQEESSYEYQPLVVEGKTWHLTQNDPPYHHNWTYYISGDTVIDCHKCKKLLLTMDDDVAKDYYSHYFKREGDFFVRMYLYEENKKIYCYTVGNTNYKYDYNKLLYDFGMNVGDKQDNYYSVMSVDTLKFNGVYRRVMYIFNKEHGINEYWIEGIGTYFPFNPGFSGKSGVEELDLIDCTFGNDILITGYDFNLAGSTNGIKNPFEQNITRNDDAIYDLQGRCVTAPQKGGLYIKNGRKIVVK